MVENIFKLKGPPLPTIPWRKLCHIFKYWRYWDCGQGIFCCICFTRNSAIESEPLLNKMLFDSQPPICESEPPYATPFPRTCLSTLSPIIPSAFPSFLVLLAVSPSFPWAFVFVVYSLHHLICIAAIFPIILVVIVASFIYISLKIVILVIFFLPLLFKSHGFYCHFSLFFFYH